MIRLIGGANNKQDEEEQESTTLLIVTIIVISVIALILCIVLIFVLARSRGRCPQQLPPTKRSFDISQPYGVKTIPSVRLATKPFDPEPLYNYQSNMDIEPTYASTSIISNPPSSNYGRISPNMFKDSPYGETPGIASSPYSSVGVTFND